MDETERPPSGWWEAKDLRYVNDRLTFGKTALDALAERATPTYVIRPDRAAENLARLKSFLPKIAVYYAVKANRHPLIIQCLREAHIDGIDVCSPNEAHLALDAGFSPEQISYTGTSVSNADLAFLASEPGIHVNADSLCALRRLLEVSVPTGKRRRSSAGVRINPELGLGYRQEGRLTYSGSGPLSKFGILREQIPDALALAAGHKVPITTLHWHVGCGWLAEQLDTFESVLCRGLEFAERFPDLTRINLGGGFGVPLQKDDVPLDLAAVRSVIERAVAGRWDVMIEPGAFLVQNTTVLLAEATTVEPKRGEWFIGLNAGFNLAMEPVFYALPAEVVPLRRPAVVSPLVYCVFVGNINEAHDRQPGVYTMPLPSEGDFFALLNVGAYGTSMASRHCLRGDYREVVID